MCQKYFLAHLSEYFSSYSSFIRKPPVRHVSRFCSKSLSQQINPRPYRSQCQCSPAHPKEPLLFQRSQTPLMQMITLHPEQHISPRKQSQCHKQVNPLPSHKRKPTSRCKPHDAQVSYQCLCRPATSKILVNENAPNRHLAPKYQKSLESCIIPQITPKFERLVYLSATSPSQSPRNSLSRTRRPPLTFWYSEEA